MGEGVFLKKFTAVILILSVFMFSAYSVSAKVSAEYYSDDITVDTVSAVPETNSLKFEDVKSVALIERDTGKVLVKQNENEKCAPASITKIMSMILFCEAIESKKLTLETKVTASEHACSMGGSQIWLEPNEEMTVDDLMKAVACASANDATVALAEEIAGSEETFVSRMNAKASQLGMNNTHFMNCSGLDCDNHYSTAYDVALMSVELLKHKLIKNYTTLWMETLRGGESELVNTNKLIRFYKGATGLKTGTTSKAGFCVSASAEKDGTELCAVVMGAKNNDGRFGTAKKLLNYGFSNYRTEKLDAKSLPDKKIPVEGGVEEYVTAKADGTVSTLVNSGSDEKLSFGKIRADKLSAPITVGRKIAEVPVMLNGKEIGEIGYYATESVEKLTFFAAFRMLLDGILTL